MQEDEKRKNMPTQQWSATGKYKVAEGEPSCLLLQGTEFLSSSKADLQWLPGLLTGLGNSQDRGCQGRKEQSRTFIVKAQNLGNLASASTSASLLQPVC